LFCYWLGSVSAILTAFYSFRLLWYTFFFNNLTFKFTTQNTHELTKSMGFALLLLSIGSVFSGFFLKDVFCGIGTTFWSNAIYQGNQNSIGLDSEFINIYIKNIPVFFSLSGLSFVFYLNNKKTPSFISLHLFFNQRWHFDFIYNYYFAYSILKYSYQFFYKLIDKGLIELLGPYSSVVVLNKLSLILKKQSLGVVYHLNCILLLSVIIIMFIFIFT
jgi:NADH:ubiquinone oxidoreductase subunit 5 (subunit L)/multisubunit Na+/H+ antiporter MnhA subunit